MAEVIKTFIIGCRNDREIVNIFYFFIKQNNFQKLPKTNDFTIFVGLLNMQ